MNLLKEYLEYIALLEFDLSKTIQNYENKIAERMKTDLDTKNKSPKDIINQIIESDPTQNKQYHQWIIKQYLSNSIKRSEDFGVISELLSKFKKLIDKKVLPLEFRDINKIKSTNDLFSLVNEYWKDDFDKSKKDVTKNEENELIENEEAKIIYNSHSLKVIIPKTEKASCYFGKNTKWCTAAKNDNQFDNYSSEGPLYIVLFKKENKRYQFHFETKQFMNELDESIDIMQLFEENPELYNVNWQTNSPVGKLITSKNQSEEIQLAAVNKNGYVIEYIKNPSEKVQLAAVNKNSYAIKYIKNPTQKVKDLYF